VHGRIILELILKYYDVTVWTAFITPRTGSRSYKQGNEFWVFHELSNSRQQSPSWKANSRSAS